MVEKQGPTDRDISHYPYEYKAVIEGMTCKNCAARVENAFHSAGEFYAKVNLDKRTAMIRCWVINQNVSLKLASI